MAPAAPCAASTGPGEGGVWSVHLGDAEFYFNVVLRKIMILPFSVCVRACFVLTPVLGYSEFLVLCETQKEQLSVSKTAAWKQLCVYLQEKCFFCVLVLHF